MDVDEMDGDEGESLSDIENKSTHRKKVKRKEDEYDDDSS